jgi:PAS domain S-box-containing protein
MNNFMLRFPFCFPALVATFFGFLFPILTAFFLLMENNSAITLDNLKHLHDQHHDLLIIWTAPLILGFFGSYVGKTNWLLKQKMDDLTDQGIRLNTLLDTAASGIVTINNAGTIMTFNQAAEQIFGYSAKEMIGKKLKELLPNALTANHDIFVTGYDAPQKAATMGQRREINGQRQNGETFPAMLRINPMLINGEQFFSGFIDDITESKALEAQLIQAQKLEAIGQLASGVAHEINTPIQYIGDNLSALQDNFSEIIACQNQLYALADNALKAEFDQLMAQHDLEFILEDSPKAIQQAMEGVERVAEIVKAMKSFSHIESSQRKQLADLHDSLKNALTISRNSYKYIASVETEYAYDIGQIECYPSELNQVFLNLIVNAAHAIEEKNNGMGVIKITTRRLTQMVEILIADNGAGIDPAIQQKVFNMFFTTKEVGKGTGQGLSLSHSIVVEKHKGKLFFESTPGIGTTFHIQLPSPT